MRLAGLRIRRFDVSLKFVREGSDEFVFQDVSQSRENIHIRVVESAGEALIRGASDFNRRIPSLRLAITGRVAGGRSITIFLFSFELWIRETIRYKHDKKGDYSHRYS